MLTAFDIPQDVTGSAHLIQQKGFGAVGIYLRPDRCSKAMIEGLSSVGLKVWSIWEKGNPTAYGYFSAEKGTADAQAAVQQATDWTQPAGSPIFFCVDFDPLQAEIEGEIQNYITAAHQVCSDAGYLLGVYGSGATIQAMLAAGVCHYGYLAGSKGFSGYANYVNDADILQTNEEATVLGWAVDLDEVRNSDVVWGIEAS